MNSTCFFLFMRPLEIIHVAHFPFLLDSAVLDCTPVKREQTKKKDKHGFRAHLLHSLALWTWQVTLKVYFIRELNNIMYVEYMIPSSK